MNLPNRSSRLPLVDLARSLSILVVLAGHFHAAHLGTRTQSVSDLLAAPGWNLFQRNGPYGVSLFFLISGFLITRVLIPQTSDPLQTISLKEFYVRRIARLLPLLLPVVVLGVILPLACTTPSPIVLFGFAQRVAPPGLYVSVLSSVANWYIIRQAILFHQWPGAYWLVFWSLSIEEQFYLFYPLALRHLKGISRAILFLAFFILAGPVVRAMACLLSHTPLWSSYNSFGAFDQIALGCLLCFVCRRVPITSRAERNSLMVLGSALMFLVYVGTTVASAADCVYGPLLLDLGLFLLLWGGDALVFRATIALRLACLPGELSYGIYLLHVTVMLIFWNVLSRWPVWVGFWGFAGLCTIVGYFSYHFYEQPMNRWIRRRLLQPPA